MAGTLTGKANIQGGYIYGTEYCDLIIGTTNICPNEENNRANKIYSKHLDIKGNIQIKDNANCTKLIIDNSQFNIYGTVTAEIINLNNLIADNIITNELTINTLLQINSNTIVTLENNERFSINRVIDCDTEYMCHINNPDKKSLLVSGNVNIDGTLSVKDDTLDTIITNKLNSQTIIRLNLDSNNNAGLLIKTQQDTCNGLLWIDNKFKLVKELDYSNPTENPDLHDLTLNDLNSNSITSTTANIDIITNNNFHKSINIINLNSCPPSAINTTNKSITLFKNGNNTETTFTLQNPGNGNPLNNYAITHTIVADQSYCGNVIIQGQIILPDGTYNSCTKIKLNKKGQNLSFLYIVDKWYIISGGAELVE